MARPKVHSGARAILRVNNKLVVYALSAQWRISTDYKVVQGIDNTSPQELAPTSIQVQVVCTTLRVPKVSASTLALQPTMLNVLHQGYVSIEIRDRGTNDTILYIPKAMLVNRTGAVAARQLATEIWTFKGMGYWDERKPQAAKSSCKSS